jgi:hypothetical protein
MCIESAAYRADGHSAVIGQATRRTPLVGRGEGKGMIELGWRLEQVGAVLGHVKDILSAGKRQENSMIHQLTTAPDGSSDRGTSSCRRTLDPIGL